MIWNFSGFTKVKKKGLYKVEIDIQSKCINNFNSMLKTDVK